MKKTLLISLDFYPKVGGVANYYFNLCRNLDKDKIVVLTDGGEEEELDFKVYRKRLLWDFIWPKWKMMFWYVWQVIRKEKIEMGWAGEVLPTGTVVYYLAKFLKLPYIVSCHGNDILQAKKFKRKEKLARKILGGAKWVGVNSKYTQELVKSLGVGEDKIRIVYPGVEARENQGGAEIAEKYGLENKKILFSVGRLVERKGFDKVIESLDEVWREVPDLMYIIGGDGPDAERLKSLAKDERIKFLGRISDEEKWAWLDLCSVFIMPARETQDDVEGFGIAYLEAGSCGKPVIAGNVGGAKEAVVDGQTGVLVNPEKKSEISEAIIKLFKDKELAKKLGENGKKRVRDEFLWNRIVKRFEEIVD